MKTTSTLVLVKLERVFSQESNISLAFLFYKFIPSTCCKSVDKEIETLLLF